MQEFGPIPINTSFPWKMDQYDWLMYTTIVYMFIYNVEMLWWLPVTFSYKRSYNGSEVQPS